MGVFAVSVVSLLALGGIVFFLARVVRNYQSMAALKRDIATKRQRLSFCYDVSSFYRLGPDKMGMLENFFEKLSHVPLFKKCSYFELNEETQVLDRLVARGLSQEYLEKTKAQFTHRVGGASTGRAIFTRKPVVSNDMTVDPTLKAFVEIGKIGGFVSLITLPVFTPKKSYGSLIVYGENKNIFSQDEVDFGQTSANLLGQILESFEGNNG